MIHFNIINSDESNDMLPFVNNKIMPIIAIFYFESFLFQQLLQRYVNIISY